MMSEFSCDGEIYCYETGSFECWWGGSFDSSLDWISWWWSFTMTTSALLAFPAKMLMVVSAKVHHLFTCCFASKPNQVGLDNEPQRRRGSNVLLECRHTWPAPPDCIIIMRPPQHVFKRWNPSINCCCRVSRVYRFVACFSPCPSFPPLIQIIPSHRPYIPDQQVK